MVPVCPDGLVMLVNAAGSLPAQIDWFPSIVPPFVGFSQRGTNSPVDNNCAPLGKPEKLILFN